jgi:hypothetical protein
MTEKGRTIKYNRKPLSPTPLREKGFDSATCDIDAALLVTWLKLIDDGSR